MNSTKNVIILAGNVILASLLIIAFCFGDIDGHKLALGLMMLGFPSVATIFKDDGAPNDGSTRPPAPGMKPPQGPSPSSYIAFALALLFEVACITPAEVKAADAAVDAGCSAVQAMTDDGQAKSVCATATELADMAAVISMLREAPPAASSSSSSAKSAHPPRTCQPLPTTTICATNAERVAGIDDVLARRSAR